MLVGLSAVLDEADSQNRDPLVPFDGVTEVVMGISLTVLSQFFAACQMVTEEMFVKSWGAPPEQVVGTEGAWGVLLMGALLVVFHLLPGDDAGSYENVLESAYMLVHSGAVAAFVVIYLVSISIFNFLGVTIAGKLSAVHRTMNDATRTSIVWAVQLLV